MPDSAESPTSRESARTSSGFSLVGRMLGMVLVVYVLGLGPAYRIAHTSKDKGHIVPMLEVVYFPFLWLFENVPFVQRPMQWYGDIWWKN